MSMLKQNKGEKVKHMTPKHRVKEAPMKPQAGTSAVEFRGTMVHSNAGVDVTHPAKHNEGSHDRKVRLHGGDGE